MLLSSFFRSDAGDLLKIIALAIERPVVSTNHVAAGLRTTGGIGTLIGDATKDFVDQACALIERPQALFHPADQAAAGRILGLSAEPLMLLYVGAMDEYDDLEPVIDALEALGPSCVELHLVGGDEYRGRYEVHAARARIVQRFHGRVPHAMVPRYIAAADLCIAPYQTTAFHEGQPYFSTLKIPEYWPARGRSSSFQGLPSAG